MSTRWWPTLCIHGKLYPSENSAFDRLRVDSDGQLDADAHGGADSTARGGCESLPSQLSFVADEMTLIQLLNDTSDSYLPFDARRPAAPPNAKPRGRKRSAMLASLQRTLSPRRHGHRSTLSNFSAFATSAAEPSSAPLEDLAATAQRLTALSSDPSVRNHPSWGHFFTPSGKDDLHSRRVEQKRLKRTISDQTMHLRNPAANEGRQATSSDAGSGNVTADVVDVGFFNAVAADRLQRSNGFDRRETSAASTALTASSDALSSLPPPTPPIDTIGSVVADHVGMDVSPKPSIAGTASPPDSRSRTQSSTKSPRVTIDSFEIMRVLGKGCAGKVLLVKEKASGELYALKAITKQHVRLWVGALSRQLTKHLRTGTGRSWRIASWLTLAPSRRF